jgi:hypothetical protein
MRSIAIGFVVSLVAALLLIFGAGVLLVVLKRWANSQFTESAAGSRGTAFFYVLIFSLVSKRKLSLSKDSHIHCTLSSVLSHLLAVSA